MSLAGINEKRGCQIPPTPAKTALLLYYKSFLKKALIINLNYRSCQITYINIMSIKYYTILVRFD